VARGTGTPGVPGASGTPTIPGVPAAGPIHTVTLDEARRLAGFPVALPRALPPGFVLGRVTVFQPSADAAPAQVFVTFERPGAFQPLAITYQDPAVASEIRAAPGAARELLVAGHPAVYIDGAAEAIRPAAGAAGATPGPVGTAPVAQHGRLIVDRPDVVLVATGDRRDGLDATALAAVVASVP
jgi:hypothetical protein